MLNHDELNVILTRENLTRDDLYLLEHHIRSIIDLQDEYLDGLPSDVFKTLQSDLNKIIGKLRDNMSKMNAAKNTGKEDVRISSMEGLRIIKNCQEKD